MIEVKHVTKRYPKGSKPALDDVSFTIRNRRIYGLLAPNGAGKSTIMNIIAGTLAPTEGTVLINGYDVCKQPIEAKRQVGYLPEQPPLFGDMTPYEYLMFVAEAKGVKGDAVEAQVKEAMALTGLVSVQDRLIHHLSKGYKQRVGLSQSLLGNPDIILLDEPFEGMDVRQITEIKELIRRLGQTKTVIVSDHIPTELSALCDHVIILSEGCVAADDAFEALTREDQSLEDVFLSLTHRESEVASADFEDEEDDKEEAN